MKAMIFAAGEGRRMLPLTRTTPKPLLQVAGQSLIEHHLRRLAAAGYREVVINVAYLGEQIVQALGDGARYGLDIHYSREQQALETGGGIRHALSLLGTEPFALINADVWSDYPLARLRQVSLTAGGAHLVLVPRPDYKAKGDFTLTPASPHRITGVGGEWTFSGISLVDPDFIALYPDGRTAFPLIDAYLWGIDRGLLSAEIYRGTWVDVGTPERLAELNRTAS